MRWPRIILIWAAFATALGVPIAAAAISPLLAWRDSVYIAAGFAGVIGLGLLLVQPMLIGGHLPGLPSHRGRRIHRWTGGALVLTVLIHVGGLWIVSPPDVIDALLFRSPTPFSAWGVIAMWSIIAAALLAALRQRLRLRLRTWRLSHTVLAAAIIIGTVVHAILIEGTMETISKVALCALVLAVTVKVMVDQKVWSKRMTSRSAIPVAD
ncbi:MAG: ferric reductase-like transmembrane domain-containing protein [Geminicoccales bacterium]